MTADTNVFIYAFDKREPVKQRVANSILSALRRTRRPIALQLVGEFRHVARRKLKMPAYQASAIAFDLMEDCPAFAYGEVAVRRALSHSALGRIGYWDALMLAAAADAGCTAMLSEDLQDGARIFGLEIVNPFAADGLSPRAAELLDIA